MSSFPYLHSWDLKEFSRGLGGPCDMCVSLKTAGLLPSAFGADLKKKNILCFFTGLIFLKVFADPEETKHLPSQLKKLFWCLLNCFPEGPYGADVAKFNIYCTHFYFLILLIGAVMPCVWLYGSLWQHENKKQKYLATKICIHSTKHYTQELMNELDLWEHKYNVEWNTRMWRADLYVKNVPYAWMVTMGRTATNNA